MGEKGESRAGVDGFSVIFIAVHMRGTHAHRQMYLFSPLRPSFFRLSLTLTRDNVKLFGAQFFCISRESAECFQGILAIHSSLRPFAFDASLMPN